MLAIDRWAISATLSCSQTPGGGSPHARACSLFITAVRARPAATCVCVGTCFAFDCPVCARCCVCAHARGAPEHVTQLIIFFSSSHSFLFNAPLLRHTTIHHNIPQLNTRQQPQPPTTTPTTTPTTATIHHEPRASHASSQAVWCLCDKQKHKPVTGSFMFYISYFML